MKLLTNLSSINSILNDGQPISTLFTSVNAISLETEKNEAWVRLAKYGEYGATVHERGIKSDKGVQVMDLEGAKELQTHFRSVINQVAHLGKGLPIYVGHPDEPAWAKENPGVTRSAVGRIKEVELREDGPYARTVFNTRGIELLSGDAPELSAHSPRFGLSEMPGRPGAYRITRLLSIGLTNDPNLPDTAISLNEEAEPKNNQTKATKTMDEETMKRLGLTTDASDDVTATTVNTKLDELQTTSTQLDEMKQKLTSANEELNKLKQEKADMQQSEIDGMLDAAIKDGRITAADKPKWKAALEADYAGEMKKLNALMKTVVNTVDHTGGVAGRKSESSANSITSINEAVADYAQANKLDLGKIADYDRAFKGAKEKNPTLFTA